MLSASKKKMNKKNRVREIGSTGWSEFAVLNRMFQVGLIRKMQSEAEPGDAEINQACVCDSLPSRGKHPCKGPGADGALNMGGMARGPVLGVAL